MLHSTALKIALVLLFGGATLVVKADTLQEARTLYDAGNNSAALARANLALRSDPGNVSALFLKAQILTEVQRIDTAIDTYRQLLAISPGHLQAYNNLAALYAQKGQLELAAKTLETAIRTDPVFTTIHANLRTIYLDMSQKHYRQALKLDIEDKPTQIAAIDINEGVDQILSQEVEVVPQSIQDAVNTTVTQAALASRRESGQQAVERSPQPVTPAEKPAPGTSKSPPSNQVVSAGEPPRIATAKPKPQPKPKADPAREVRQALLAWANAWSNRDVQRYVNAYSNDYATPGKTNKDWAAGRRWNFKNKKYIRVALSDIKINPVGDRYRASFTQEYESDNYSDVVSKELLFVRQSGQWKIAEEETS